MAACAHIHSTIGKGRSTVLGSQLWQVSINTEKRDAKSEYEAFKFITSFPELFFIVVDVLQVWVTLSLSYTYVTVMYRSQWESAVGKRS